MPAYHFSPYVIPAAVTAAVVVFCAVTILFTRFSRSAVAIFILGMTVAAWQIANGFADMAAEPHTGALWSRIAWAAAFFVGAAAYQFVASFLVDAFHRRVIAAAAWVFAAQFAILALTSQYFITGITQWSGTAFFIALFVIAAVDIVREFRTAKSANCERIRLFGIALLIGSLAATDLIPGHRDYGWLAILAATGTVIYTIRKYGAATVAPTLPATEIISTMRDLLLVSDRDGKIQFANNAACAFLGYAREDMIGRPLEELLVPSGASEPVPLQGWVRDREYVFRTKMGQPIELTLSHSPVMQNGEVNGAIIIGRDLRERKRYEWEARRAVTLLESTLDSTADGILVIGQEGRLLTWNQRFADLWNIPAEVLEQDEDKGLIGLLVEQLVDPVGFLNNLAELHEHPEIESVHVLQLKDGRRLEQYSIGRYLDEQPLRVWSFRDVTARLAAEDAVRESESRYRLLFEQNAAGVCLAKMSGRIISSNATFADMIGYSVDDLAKRELRDVFASAATLDEVRRRLGETPTVRGMEIEMRRRDRETVSTLANVSLVGSGENALVHMTAVDITDRKRAEEQIEFQAYHDALTQLPNRRLFVERLEMSLLTAKRTRGNVAVLFIDLDRFKNINDSLGHSVADALLVEIAQRLRSCVRQTDTVARHGGDEFTIMLPDLNQPEDAAQVAEKILERVAEPVVIGSTTIEISVSIGIAVSPFDGTDIDTLLRNADDAMYRAKQAGRNTYQLCTDQMKTRAMERLSMQSRLRKAMNDDELVLAYQPETSLRNGLIVGAEAVVRWNDPERGLMEPNEFIPIAEETRLIVPLGEWALLTACKQLRRWTDAGIGPLRMAVNISARQFQQRDLPSLIRRVVDETGIDPAALELELRETTVMRDLDLAIELLTRLRDTGVSIAVHDFGSAYSSLGSLRLLPINAVKMDRSLISTSQESDVAIVHAVIGVSARLGLRVSADGVDTREQFEMLKRSGCDEAQGLYFSPPVDAEKFAGLMATAQD